MNQKLKIIVKPMPSQDFPQTNSDLGYFYEDIVKKITLRHIPSLKSIHDPGVFSKSRRYAKGIKTFFIDGKNENQVYENFNKAVKNNDFVIFPFLNYVYVFFVNEKKYTIEINGANIKVYQYISENNRKECNHFFDKGTTIFFKHKSKEYYFKEFNINNIICSQIYLLSEDIFMVIFIMDLEIDGFFIAEEEFQLGQYKADELFFCSKGFKDNLIKKDTYIIYEIKSGKNITSLTEQIQKDYYFFDKFFQLYPKYDIKKFIFFGFLRTEKKFEQLKKLHENEFNTLSLLPNPAILFRYENFLFGENPYYDNIELGEIGELKILAIKNAEKIDNLTSKFEDLSGKIEDLKNDLQDIKASLSNNKFSPEIPPYPAFNYQNVPSHNSQYPFFHPFYCFPIPMYVNPPNQSSAKYEEISKKKNDK